MREIVKTNPKGPRGTPWLAAAVAIATVIAFAATGAGTPTSDDPLAALPPETQDVVRMAQAKENFDLQLPANPQGALENAVAELLEDAGFPSNLAAGVQDAALPDEVAGRLANLLTSLAVCNDATQDAIATVGLTEIVRMVREDPTAFDPTDFAAIEACVPAAMSATTDLELFVELGGLPSETSTSNTPPLLDIWPVVLVDTGGDDFYPNDYMVIVDTSGDDVYHNNAGSNMIDTRFAPSSSPVPGVDPIPHVPGVNDGDDDRSGFGPSEGCAIALGSLLSGNCTPLQSVFLDTVGEDQYGVFEPPLPGIDGRCTADPVIRRMVTIGVGFLGVGVLLDTVGDDSYNGKTGSNGAGHIFGSGFQIDRQGHDHHLAVRNAQGFVLIGNSGLLLEEEGNDVYEFYLPSALDPDAPNEQDGAGGVIDDTNVCDNVLRLLQGAGNVGGIGILVDQAGVDTYHGACTTSFLAPGDIGSPVCSQGWGALGGLGVLVDGGGQADTYLGEVPDRANDKLIVDQNVALDDPNTPENEREVTVELFLDQ